MNVVVATACAAGSSGEQTPTPDSLTPERQMPLLPVPELETPLLLQPLLPVPEFGRQVDCGSRGSRGRRRAGLRGRGARGDAWAVERRSSRAARQRVLGVSSMAVYISVRCGMAVVVVVMVVVVLERREEEEGRRKECRGKRDTHREERYAAAGQPLAWSGSKRRGAEPCTIPR